MTPTPAGKKRCGGGEAHAYVVLDTDGTVCWGLCDPDKRLVSAWAKHPKRKVGRVEVVAIVRKAKGKRRGKRGG